MVNRRPGGPDRVSSHGVGLDGQIEMSAAAAATAAPKRFPGCFVSRSTGPLTESAATTVFAFGLLAFFYKWTGNKTVVVVVVVFLIVTRFTFISVEPQKGDDGRIEVIGETGKE